MKEEQKIQSNIKTPRPQINYNIRLLPIGNFVFQQTLAPPYEEEKKEKPKRPLYAFPISTGSTHSLIVYGSGLVTLD
ncbi:MAG: hypothetical protein QXE05_00920 [Nitrososphaeria archaeon]